MCITVEGALGVRKSNVPMLCIDSAYSSGVSLATVDLNLLRSLDALLEQRSVTLAAQRMGISQPSMSTALARLRRHFDDELLTRAGRQYRLTPLAVQLRERVRVAVTATDRVFDAQPGFVPASSTREFRLVVSDYAVHVFGRVLTALLAREAPQARIRLAMATEQAVYHPDQLLLNTDLMVLPHGFLTDVSHHDLYRDEWLCVVSADNSTIGDHLTIEQLESLPWVASHHSPTASTPAARILRMLGIEPRVQVVAESFLTVPELIAGSDRVALLQRRLVERLPAGVGIRALACPFEAGPLVEAMWWHPVYDADPEHTYLRDLLLRATASLRQDDGAAGAR